MFGYFYQQTEYSMLDNLNKIDKYIDKAKKFNYTFLTITDNNLHGAFKFYLKCIENNIKPIIGLELTINFSDFKEKVLLYALNNCGLANLIKISSLEKLSEKSVNYLEIKKYAKDICVIVINKSNIYSLVKSNSSKAIKNLDSLKQLFNNLYFGIDFINDKDFKIIDFCNNNKITPVIINKTSYLEKDDLFALNILRKISKNEKEESGCYLLKKEEFLNIYKNYFYLIENTNNLANNINISINYGNLELPVYPNSKNVSSFEYLSALCFYGLNKRLHGKKDEVYIKRLNMELNTINMMGFTNYFLIVWDLIKFAKNNFILIGPGRGSAAGSLVSYCLGITEIDPIKYNLLFARFLNSGRKNMPDIDIDIEDISRDKLINYVINKYGRLHVCTIVTFQEFQSRGALRDVAKILGFKSFEIDEIIKNLESKDNLEFLKNKNEKIKELFDIVEKISKLPRQTGTHAAGIILSDKSLFGVIPLQTGVNDVIQSQYEAYDLEKIGLLKIDFLGLRNLTAIKKTLSLIKENLNINLDLKSINLDDKKTYELLKNADTMGIFQLESRGMRSVMKRLKPNNLLDISHLIALYRPGPMENIDDFIYRKNNHKTNFFIPSLNDIVKETYGVIIYQEQIMLIAQKYANYSESESDILRRAMSKKNHEAMEIEKNNFIKKAAENNKNIDEAKKLFDYILKFANYGFNKSHSVAYALVAYQMSYLKANYTIYFMATMLNNVLGNDLQTNLYIENCKVYNIEVLRPNINISTLEYIVKDKAIIMPLLAIKNLGLQSAKNIIEARKDGFKSYYDFLEKTELNTNVIENLIFAGAFDSFKVSKKNMLSFNDKAKLRFSKLVDDLLVKEEEFDLDYLKNKEKQALGINIVNNILYPYYKKYIEKYDLKFISQLKNNLGLEIYLILLIKSVVKRNINNNTYYLLGVYDGFLNFNIKAYNFDFIKENDIVILKGKPHLINNNLELEIINLKKIN